MADADTETAEESAADSTATSGTGPATAETGPEDDTADSADADTQTASEPAAPDNLVDEITDSLSGEGYDVFHGREQVTLRQNGEIAPNRTVSEQYLDGAVSVMLAYYKRTKTIAIIPLPTHYDKPGIYKVQWGNNRAQIRATKFLKEHDITTNQTIRYQPEWDETVTDADLPGALLIDLREDGEVVYSKTDTDESEGGEANTEGGSDAGDVGETDSDNES
ncbi:hypothetical protein GCM10027355_36280 [Haloplanus salinarum]|uniref:hypothetical protein n=1 Tax=Haloplanus salinarum TaxID=1912324 RepID=UPI003B4280A7